MSMKFLQKKYLYKEILFLVWLVAFILRWLNLPTPNSILQSLLIFYWCPSRRLPVHSLHLCGHLPEERPSLAPASSLGNTSGGEGRRGKDGPQSHILFMTLSQVVKELVDVGDEYSAGLMVGSAGNNETADSVSLSKTILMTLKEGDQVNDEPQLILLNFQVYVGALKIGEYFPYAGLYITFCATLLQKRTTEVESSAFTGEKPSSVLGPRFK